LQPYASLAQTQAILGRSKEAIAAAEKGRELAQTANKRDKLKQFEDWLAQYRAEINNSKDAEEKPSAAPSGKGSQD